MVKQDKRHVIMLTSTPAIYDKYKKSVYTPLILRFN